MTRAILALTGSILFTPDSLHNLLYSSASISLHRGLTTLTELRAMPFFINNFFDTADMYPVDVRVETYGHTEHIIGDWLFDRGCHARLD